MDQFSVIEKYYNDNVEAEWNRFERHPIEFEITKRILSGNLPQPPARIIDIGGGPGRYSIWLAGQGYDVSLFDLAQANIDYAQKMADRANVRLREHITGNALHLSQYVENDTYDCALLMGPLYHLIEEEDRASVIRQTLACLKQGGSLISSFISGYAPIIDILKNYPDKMNGNIQEYLAYLEDGRNIVSDDNPGFTTAYFMDPKKIDAFMNNFNITKKGLFTVESILGPYENLLKSADTHTFDSCVELAMHFVEDPSCRACGEHLLYIGIKK
jgi:2-polyprenyl-3-methyl-5-hydroxy-6-metoxy-1,4-benzoquinol methylase